MRKVKCSQAQNKRNGYSTRYLALPLQVWRMSRIVCEHCGPPVCRSGRRTTSIQAPLAPTLVRKEKCAAESAHSQGWSSVGHYFGVIATGDFGLANFSKARSTVPVSPGAWPNTYSVPAENRVTCRTSNTFFSGV